LILKPLESLAIDTLSTDCEFERFRCAVRDATFVLMTAMARNSKRVRMVGQHERLSRTILFTALRCQS
jgi:hypothetical protein